MSKLRNSARGQQCLVRLPGHCNGNPETVVLAHLRVAGLGGTGMKPPDWAGAFACSGCHDAIDGRAPLDPAIRPVLWKYVMEGHLRTMRFWVDEGLVSHK
jgi:hypothetical protein